MVFVTRVLIKTLSNHRNVKVVRIRNGAGVVETVEC